MERNKALIITLAMVAMVGLASLAIAGPGRQAGFGDNGRECMGTGNYGPRMGYTPGQIAQLTPEKQEAYKKIMDAFRTKMTPLREAMWQKRLELKALSPNPNTQPDEIRALVKEMGALHSQIRTEHEDLKNRLEKEIGLKVGKGGFHHPRRGNGMRDHQGRGYGMMNGAGQNAPCNQ
jgi:zinc resistance-associated protein